jgi:uncharacterized protein
MTVQTTSPVALTPSQTKTIRSIIEKILPGCDVRVFGSRATSHARPYSDLDLLVVKPARLAWRELADLRDQFEASDLPFKVDVVEAAALHGDLGRRALDESVALKNLYGNS